MACFNPLRAWRGGVLPSGKRAIVFKEREAQSVKTLDLPCGQCVGCRLERSAQWAARCLDEASLFEKNCFITLTYDEVRIPEDGSLVKRDFQLFMKKLRKRFGEGIRYYMCGEYGDTTGRPHYHACLFNFRPDDLFFFKKTDQGHCLYTSKSMEEIWDNGYVIIGDVTFESAAYVARYIMKKITGDGADERYVDKDSGVMLEPEYTNMSRGSKKLGTGGIGKEWYNRFKGDLFPDDFKVVDGRKIRVPRFYSSMYELTNPEEFAKIKAKREKVAQEIKRSGELDGFRLRTKEVIKKAQINFLKRS